MKTTCLLGVTLILVAPASAAPIYTFAGSDPGAAATDPRPQSDAAAANFDAAAAALGAVSLVTFEDLRTGQFNSRTVAPGVTAVQTDYDTSLGGILGAGSSYVSAVLGYNTTPGGEKFLSFVPQVDIGSAQLDFVFATPVQAWGAYLVGLESNIAGSVAVQFTDGTDYSYPLSESVGGGPQFFGLVAPGRSIAKISLAETGISVTRDIYGVDDMRYVAVPEPGSLLLLVMGASLLLGRGWWRR